MRIARLALRLDVSPTRLPGGLETTLHVSRTYLIHLVPVLLGNDQLPADGIPDVSQLEDPFLHLVRDFFLCLRGSRAIHHQRSVLRYFSVGFGSYMNFVLLFLHKITSVFLSCKCVSLLIVTRYKLSQKGIYFSIEHFCWEVVEFDQFFKVVPHKLISDPGLIGSGMIFSESGSC